MIFMEKTPIVNPDNNDYVIRRLWFDKGFFGGGNWKFTYSKRSRMNLTSECTFGEGTSVITIGGEVKFYIDWS
jgi:hypothetical protein